MARALPDKRKTKPVGRPRTGITPLVAFRPPTAMVDAIDRWAEGASVSRSEAMRRLIELGLQAKRTGKPR